MFFRSGDAVVETKKKKIMKQKTQILFLKETTNEPMIEGNVIAYFPAEHKTAFKTNGKLFKMEEFPGVDMTKYERAEKSQYRNLLTDLIVSGEKNVQVLNNC